MYDAQILLVTAASIAFLHTILGPDHYLVFSVMGKARRWTLEKTLRVTLMCGAGHVLSSMLLGAIGLLLGTRLASLVAIEGARGGVAGWLLLAFGLMYFAWGLRQAARNKRHSHVHVHEDIVHDHEHDHHSDHSHVHDQPGKAVTPWALFIIFVLGPCEALIPLLMYPAARLSETLVIAVALVFSLITHVTMLACVAVTMIGLQRVRLPAGGRFGHAAAGALVLGCGIAVSFLGI
mgnify:CR=1 FL=1